jgi:hypothetical protein
VGSAGEEDDQPDGRLEARPSAGWAAPVCADVPLG